MEELTKDVLVQILEEVSRKVNSATKKDYEDDDWYYNLMWRDELEEFFGNAKGMTTEDQLALQAVRYPDLYPVVREIVEGIIKINNEYWNAPIDVYEWAAGSFFAEELAMATGEDEDIRLFARHLATRDLDHEEISYQFSGVWEIFEKYGYTEKTMPVLIALFFANSQHIGEYFTYDMVDEISAYLNKGDNLNDFLKELASAKKSYGHGSIEEMFELFLCQAMDLDDEKAEEAEEIFLSMVKKGRTPAKEDFLSLKE